MGELTVAVDPALAHDLQKAAGSPEFRDLLAALGVDLSPLHPGTNDPELARWFYANVSDEAAERAAQRLREHPGVVAAYSKPPGDLP